MLDDTLTFTYAEQQYNAHIIQLTAEQSIKPGDAIMQMSFTTDTDLTDMFGIAHNVI